MTKVDKLLKLLNEEEVEFKSKVSKEKEKVDKYATDKELDSYETEDDEKTVYADPKSKKVVGVYDKKSGKYYTDLGKDDIEKEIK